MTSIFAVVGEVASFISFDFSFSMVTFAALLGRRKSWLEYRCPSTVSIGPVKSALGRRALVATPLGRRASGKPLGRRASEKPLGRRVLETALRRRS